MYTEMYQGMTRILLLDDDSVSATEIKLALRGYDYDVFIADELATTVEQIKSIPEKGGMFNNRMKRIMLSAMGGLATAATPANLATEKEMGNVLGKYRHQGKGSNKQGGTKPSNAAQLKRAATKRNNISKRGKK